MPILIFFVLAVVLVIGWVSLRDRIQRLEWEVCELNRKLDARRADPVATPVSMPAPTPSAGPVIQTPPSPPAPKAAPVPVVPAAIPPAPSPRRDWEAVLGENWLLKAGMFVLVVGLAMLLGYSFKHIGPGGRVSISIAASLALLASGAILEPRERYGLFARGLLGGGWAGLYVTVYAMHAVEAAKVIDNAIAGVVLLLIVAAGMIAHSLRYRSQTVTGLAYFVAFGTLAITDATSLPFLALIPLAASLLYVAHRFAWTRMTLMGLIATYAVVVLRGDMGAPFWQAQTMFALYWLMFEAYDVLHPGAWLLPLNAAGAVGLSVLKWQVAAPEKLWMPLAVFAAGYLVSAGLRSRSGRWQGAATLTAMLAAGAIFLKADPQWVVSALAVEAELFYLAGVRLRARYLRWLGTALFGVETLHLLAIDLWGGTWVTAAVTDAALFYANRFICTADNFFGYAGAAMVALVISRRTHEPYRGMVFEAAAVIAFAFGWWRRLIDFRKQGYLLLLAGMASIAAESRLPSLSVAAGVCYAGALCALWSGADRFADDERDLVRLGGAGLAAGALMAMVWRLTPGEYLGVGWMALALVVLEVGMRRLPEDLRRIAYAVAAVGVLRICLFNLQDPRASGAIFLWAALLAYAIAIRARKEEGGLVLTGASTVGLVFALIGAWALLPAEMFAAVCAAAALAVLLAAKMHWGDVLLLQSCAAAGLAYALSVANCADLSRAVWPTCVVIACFFAAQLVSERETRLRLYFSLLATTLTTVLLYFRISGSMFTVAWGIEGVCLLGFGFPLRDRVLRLSGLTLLLGCILKLFLWDLRHLEILPRILSAIVLGVILLGVSWIYTRFRERVTKFL